MAEDAAMSSGYHYPEREAMESASTLNLTAMPAVTAFDLYAGDPEPVQDQGKVEELRRHEPRHHAEFTHRKVTKTARKATRKAQRQARRANR